MKHIWQSLVVQDKQKVITNLCWLRHSDWDCSPLLGEVEKEHVTMRQMTLQTFLIFGKSNVLLLHEIDTEIVCQVNWICYDNEV